MGSITEPKGIIYCAENKVTGMKYFGQTVRPLEDRIKAHYQAAKKAKHKFAKALREYEKETWEWSVVIEVEVSKLNDYEVYFIAHFDTQKNGLNTHHGGAIWESSPGYSNELFTLYHPAKGLVSKTKLEWIQQDKAFYKLSELVKGTRSHIKGWVTQENVENYNARIVDVYDFYHADFGAVTCTTSELRKKYLPKECNRKSVYELATGKIKAYLHWILAENKEQYEELVSSKRRHNQQVTLKHNLYGVITATRTEFKERFSLYHCDIYGIVSERRLQSKGWSLVKEEANASNSEEQTR